MLSMGVQKGGPEGGPEGDPEGGPERGAEGGSRFCLHPTVRLLERFQIKTLTRKACSRVC